MIVHCVNHPGLDASGACANCGRPFCDSCLVEFLGQRFCGPCRNMRLAQVQGPQAGVGAPFAGTGTVDIGRWLGAGWQIIQNDLPTFAVASFLAWLLGTFSCGIVYGPLQCGVFLMIYRKMTYGQTEMGNLFDGFRRFLNAFLVVLLIGLASIAARVILQIPTIAFSFAQVFSSGGRPSTGASSLYLLVQAYDIVTAALSTAVVGGATFFAVPHVAARNANPIEALSYSWEVFRRNPVMFSVASLVFALVTLLGLVGFCIGVFVTMPLTEAARAQAYADHFGIQGWESAA